MLTTRGSWADRALAGLSVSSQQQATPEAAQQAQALPADTAQVPLESRQCPTAQLCLACLLSVMCHVCSTALACMAMEAGPASHASHGPLQEEWPSLAAVTSSPQQQSSPAGSSPARDAAGAAAGSASGGRAGGKAARRGRGSGARAGATPQAGGSGAATKPAAGEQLLCSTFCQASVMLLLLRNWVSCEIVMCTAANGVVQRPNSQC